MRKLWALAPALFLIGLSVSPADARVDPVVLLQPAPAGCVVPASDLRFPCGPLRAPDRPEATACNLPAVYLGGRPGPCPPPQAPPEIRVVPLRAPDLSR